MAKKLSTAMLTALAIAHSKGVVQIGDDQRAALLGMAGRVSANTIYALHALGSLRCTLDGLHYELTPILEMFNTFNNANNINPLSTPALFNFDGFLRTGVGDPRQVQLAVKFTF